jgi:hypothetical protein
MKWRKIEDQLVRHLWRCAACEDKGYFSAAFYGEAGVPFCVECDQDMEYVLTEIFD